MPYVGPDAKEKQRKYNAAYRKAHLDKQRAYNVAYRKAHLEERRTYESVYREVHREEKMVYSHNYYLSHRTERLEKEKVSYALNPTDKRLRARTWKKENPERVRIHGMRRRALKNRASGTCSANQIQARVNFYGGCCWVCLLLGRRTPYEAIDHVSPLTMGGSNWPSNLRPICRHHNSQKRAMMPTEFLKQFLKRAA